MTTPTVADMKAARGDLEREAARRRYERDPWAWICETVLTIDELDKTTPVKRFPVAACVPCGRYVGHDDRTRCPTCRGTPKPLAYLEHLTKAWYNADPPILIIPKARRMLLSWAACAWHTWLALYQPHSKVFLISDRESKSAELLDRCQGILERLPEDRCARPQLHRTIAPPVLSLGNGAAIYGMAEGSDVMRQYTATAALCDELAHWAWPRASYSALKPTVDRGGRLTIVSSAAPGFFAELVRGEALG
jgi:hypothetical protein